MEIGIGLCLGAILGVGLRTALQKDIDAFSKK
jgi:hypothetical protein